MAETIISLVQPDGKASSITVNDEAKIVTLRFNRSSQGEMLVFLSGEHAAQLGAALLRHSAMVQ